MLDVTIVVVPRERYSLTERALTTLYDNTAAPLDLLYVSAGAPAAVQRYLEAAAREKGFRLITTGYLSPNQARNLALSEVSSKYVVFLDNDALVAPGWLEQLVQCAEDTGAAIVGPLYLVGELEDRMIHMAGGMLHFRLQDGKRIVYDEHLACNVPLDTLTTPLSRRQCDFVEFHCMLVRTAFLREHGALDAGLLSHHEHIDVGWMARSAGATVFMEPAALATYLPPPPFDWSDLPYFMLRWCDDWGSATIDHFRSKWGVAATRHWGDEAASLDVEDTAVRFGRAHRRRITGLQVPGDWDDAFDSAIDQARLMVALFQSVDRDTFDLALASADDFETESHIGRPCGETLERLPALLRRGRDDHLSVLIRPREPRRGNAPALLCLNVERDALPDVEPHAFMIIEDTADRFQAWFALDRSSSRSATLLRRLAPAGVQSDASSSFSRVAGSVAIDPESSSHARVTLRKGTAGGITTAMELEGGPARPHLWSSKLY